MSKRLTFQNLMYTVKFEPVSNILEANLVSNVNQVIRGETLILDASNSFITNMPINLQEKVLGFEWICPQIFTDVCNAKSGNQISIDFSEVSAIPEIEYEQPFEFKVNVVWAKPDGSQ